MYPLNHRKVWMYQNTLKTKTFKYKWSINWYDHPLILTLQLNLARYKNIECSRVRNVLRSCSAIRSLLAQCVHDNRMKIKYQFVYVRPCHWIWNVDKQNMCKIQSLQYRNNHEVSYNLATFLKHIATDSGQNI